MRRHARQPCLFCCLNRNRAGTCCKLTTLRAISWGQCMLHQVLATHSTDKLQHSKSRFRYNTDYCINLTAASGCTAAERLPHNICQHCPKATQHVGVCVVWFMTTHFWSDIMGSILGHSYTCNMLALAVGDAYRTELRPRR